MHTNNRERPTEIPPRVRCQPSFFLAGLLYFLPLWCAGEGVLGRDAVIYKEQPSISINESSWTVVTDILLHDAETAMEKIE